MATHGVFWSTSGRRVERCFLLRKKVLAQAARHQETIGFPDLLKPVCSVIIFVGTSYVCRDVVRSRLESHNRLRSLG